MPSPDEFWQWLVGGIASAAGGMFGYHKYVDNRIEKKADKTEMREGFTEIREEMARSRDVQAKLFDQQRESDQKSEERHRELLMHLVQRKD